MIAMSATGHARSASEPFQTIRFLFVLIVAFFMIRMRSTGTQVTTISPNPDFNSILRVDGKIFSVTQYESPRPGVAYLTELRQDKTTGELTVSHRHLMFPFNL